MAASEEEAEGGSAFTGGHSGTLPGCPTTPLSACGSTPPATAPAVVWATVLTVLNKVFDVFPEILIGVAIDVVVNANDSFVADITGVDGRGASWSSSPSSTRSSGSASRPQRVGLQSLWRNLAQTVEHEARMDTYAHVQRLELGYFEDQSTGGLMAVLNDDVNQLERFLDTGASAIIRHRRQRRSWSGSSSWSRARCCALVAFAPIPIIVCGILPLPAPAGAALPGGAQPGRRALNGTLANNLGGIATIKAFTAEDREIARVAGESDGLPRGERPTPSSSAQRLRPPDPDRDPRAASR